MGMLLKHPSFYQENRLLQDLQLEEEEHPLVDIVEDLLLSVDEVVMEEDHRLHIEEDHLHLEEELHHHQEEEDLIQDLDQEAGLLQRDLIHLLDHLQGLHLLKEKDLNRRVR